MDKILRIEGRQILATLAGDPNNPPIIMIHGLASHRGVWRQTIAALEQKYYCIAMDLLGFGASDKPDKADYSIPTQGKRVLQIANQLGIQHFSLIGHSMGGQIALYITSMLAPEQVTKLVSVAGVMTGSLSERVEKINHSFIKMARNNIWMYGMGRSLLNFRPCVNWGFRPWFYNMNSIPFKDWEADRLAAFNPACHISTDESWKALLSVDLSKYLYKVKAPTLIISGVQDGTVPVGQAYLAQTIIPNNQLALIEKCGHFPMYEKTNHYLKALALLL